MEDGLYPMVFYNEDWEKTGAIPDYKTINVSFLRMSKLLEQMGKKNTDFFLALHDQGLQGVDPFDYKHLTTEMKQRIAIECKINPWYFVRECVRIEQHGGGVEPGPYLLSRANLAMMWLYFQCFNIFTTVPRQNGKTIAAMVITYWVYGIAGSNLSFALFADRNQLVQENVDRLKFIRDNIPKYLVVRQTEDTENKEGLSCNFLKTQYSTHVPQRVKSSAQGQARGESNVGLHFDEFAWYFNNHMSYSSILSTTRVAQPQAREHGLRVANMITTTAGVLNYEHGAFAHRVKMRAMPFSEHLYDIANREELENILSVNSQNGMFYLQFSYKQLGRSDEWLEQCRREADDPLIFRTDYLNEWVQQGGDSLFTETKRQQLHLSRSEPLERELFHGIVVNWYIDRNSVSKSELPLIMGIDTSDNTGNDYTCGVIIDPRTLTTVATFRCNKSNLTYVAQWLTIMLYEWPRMVLIPERNKNGQYLIDILLRVMSLNKKDYPVDPYTRIFNTVFQDGQHIGKSLPDPTNNSTMRKRFGFNTTRSETSRPLLFSSVLSGAVNNFWQRILDSMIIDEVLALEVGPTGKIEAGDGSHDDMVIAWLLAVYMCMYGQHLDAYGINQHEILDGLRKAQHGTGDPIQDNRRDMQIKRYQELKQKLESGHLPDSIAKAHAEELRYLARLIPDNVINEEVVGPNQLEAEKARENKVKNARAVAPEMMLEDFLRKF